jgi:hypothetical protein
MLMLGVGMCVWTSNNVFAVTGLTEKLNNFSVVNVTVHLSMGEREQLLG